jgi:nicotinate-nucleotide pyrophosphorylase (carboxylating)
MSDPRPLLFAGVCDATVKADMVAQESGIVIGVEEAARVATEVGAHVRHRIEDAARVDVGQTVLSIEGSPLAIALAEERLVGIMAKPSGIATAAANFVARAAGSVRVVSGAWKKLPFSQKSMLRTAVAAGGVEPRIADWPFLYLDKNFVSMLGGVVATLSAAAAHPELRDYRRVIQVTTVDDAVAAARAGAQTIFVDTGRFADLSLIADALHHNGLRPHVEIAFGGGISLEDLDVLRNLDVDVIDVGRAIVDAPLLDMTLRVQDRHD